MELFALAEMPGLFVDAFVADERAQLLFASLWGQDTTVQEWLARLSLPINEGGISTLTINDQAIAINPARPWRQHTGRVPNALFQGLSQVWLYDALAVDMDRANRRALLLCEPTAAKQDNAQRLWQAVRELCRVPLLNEWHSVLKHFRERGWIQFFKGTGVNAIRIDLSSDAVEGLITQLLRGGHLSLLTLSKTPEVNFAHAG